MTPALILLGALLVGLALHDAVITTMSAGNGGGPLTQRVGRWVWRGLTGVSSGGASRLLPYAGTAVLLATLLIWVTLLWSGWTLIFASSPEAVLVEKDQVPASLAGRIYFAGFVVFTLGVGDLVPGSGAWQVATAVATFLGLSLVTLSITYLVSVVSAAVSRRALARDIHLSGKTGTEIVRLHWTGSRVSAQLDALATTLSSQILKTSQQHLAYPVLHHFHAAQEASSAPRALAALDDALVVLSVGLRPEARPGEDTLTRLRRALEHYAQTVQAGTRQPPHDPPLPDLAPLRAAGVPVVSDGELALAVTPHLDRRRKIDQLVRADAWTWPCSETQPEPRRLAS